MNRFESHPVEMTAPTWWRICLACMLMLGLAVTSAVPQQTINLQKSEMDFSTRYDAITPALISEALRLETSHQQITSTVDNTDPPEHLLNGCLAVSAQVRNSNHLQRRHQKAAFAATYFLPLNRAPPLSLPA